MVHRGPPPIYLYTNAQSLAMVWKSVRAKIQNEDYTRLVYYCEQEGVTVSALIRDLIEERINHMQPIHKAGINRMEYNKASDSFDWILEFDDGSKTTLAESLSPAFLEDLASQISSALSSRSNYLRSSDKGSVPIPKKLRRIKGV